MLKNLSDKLLRFHVFVKETFYVLYLLFIRKNLYFKIILCFFFLECFLEMFFLVRFILWDIVEDKTLAMFIYSHMFVVEVLVVYVAFLHHIYKGFKNIINDYIYNYKLKQFFYCLLTCIGIQFLFFYIYLIPYVFLDELSFWYYQEINYRLQGLSWWGSFIKFIEVLVKFLRMIV